MRRFIWKTGLYVQRVLCNAHRPGIEPHYHLDRLPDGDYTPLLIGKSTSTELEAIRKFGREILTLPASEKMQRRLLGRVSILEKRLADAEEQITALKEKISRGTTF